MRTTIAGPKVGGGSGTARATERGYDGTLSRVRDEVIGVRIEARAGSRARLRSWGLSSNFRSRCGYGGGRRGRCHIHIDVDSRKRELGGW